MTWTPDRPTKPGKYWLSLPKHLRAELDAMVGYETQPCFVVSLDLDRIESLHINGALDSVRVQDWLADALWRPYVDPPDPFAEPVPVEMYRMSDDAKTPNLRLILSVDPGEVVLYEADMTSRSATAKETAVHDKIIMSPADARWLRDALQQVDLSDQPEVTSAAPVPSLREKIEALPDLVLGSGRVIGGAVDRGAVLALLDEVTR